MIATQVKFNNHISYSYDSHFDTLRVTFKYSQDFYYEEPYPDFFLRYDESNDEIVGLQILNAKKFDSNILLDFVTPPLVFETQAMLKNLFT